MELRLVILNACLYRCGEAGIPHVWDTDRIPPFDDQRCMCGQVTWAQGVVLARIRAERLREGYPSSPAVLPSK